MGIVELAPTDEVPGLDRWQAQVPTHAPAGAGLRRLDGPFGQIRRKSVMRRARRRRRRARAGSGR